MSFRFLRFTISIWICSAISCTCISMMGLAMNATQDTNLSKSLNVYSKTSPSFHRRTQHFCTFKAPTASAWIFMDYHDCYCKNAGTIYYLYHATCLCSIHKILLIVCYIYCWGFFGNFFCSQSKNLKQNIFATLCVI